MRNTSDKSGFLWVRQPDEPERQLRRRFAKISRRSFHPIPLHRRYRWAIQLCAFAALTLAALFVISRVSPWPLVTTLRHIASAPNCTAARVVGLAPARYGQPGYWGKHDADRDGIACEPWPR
ncbi:excalibur calcium-binding domain-containing protein [Stappia indica]|uniref:excalibur calcium-binding domain-containing protein n=1 Tax=Stappia indica TaxID=538381 RepID=UPI0009F28AC4|nr:excalibur calcium-binding domain-containing protein [Stappia indica]